MLKKILFGFAVMQFIVITGVSAATFEIDSVNDWKNYAKVAKNSTNAVVNINEDLNFANEVQSHIDVAKGTVIEGNNHVLSNIKIKELFIRENYGTIRNLQIKNLSATGTDRVGFVAYNRNTMSNINVENVTIRARDRIGFVVENYGTIKNMRVSNFKLYGRSYVAPIAKNFSYLYDIKTAKGYVVAETFGSGIVGLMHDMYNKGAYLKLSSTDSITLKSKLAEAKKPYRNTPYMGHKKDLKGDFFGGLVGKNENAIVYGSKANNIAIYADDALGGAVGYNNFKKYNSKTRTAFVSATHVTNVTIYGGGKIGGLVGSNNNNNKVNLKQITVKAKGKALRARILNSSVKGNLKIVACINAGGAVGFSNNAYIEGTVVNVNNKPVNVYGSVEEVAGFVGEMEFGYTRTSRTNATVKTKGKEVAGFVGDSEGTIVYSHSTSRVYGKNTIAGFVSSNMGYIGRSSFTGKVYASSGKKGKAVFVGNFSSYKAKAKKYRGYYLKPRYVKCKSKGSRYVKGKKVKNAFFGTKKGN